MDFITEELHNGVLEKAASMPQVIDGDKLKPKALKLKQRPNGVWAVHKGSVYLKGLGTEDHGEATILFDLYKHQLEARKKGIREPKFADAIQVVDHHLKQIPSGKKNAIRNDTERLKRMRPYLKGKRIIDLDGEWANATEEAMLDEYAASVVEVSFTAVRSAIKTWFVARFLPVAYPFKARPKAQGCDRVLTPEEQERVMTWAETTTQIDSDGKVRRLGRRELLRRRTVGRLTELGLATGSRGGKHAGMTWGPNGKFGHIDVDAGVMYRCPIGALVSATKKAPSVDLSPGLLAKVRRWRAEDGDGTAVFGHWKGTALGQMFALAMRRLGIHDVTLHTLRHTCISRLIEKRVPAGPISALCGISTSMLRTRYNHSEELAVQPMAHAAMDAILAR